MKRWIERQPVWRVLLAWLFMAAVLGLLLVLTGCEGAVGGSDFPEPQEGPPASRE